MFHSSGICPRLESKNLNAESLHLSLATTEETKSSQNLLTSKLVKVYFTQNTRKMRFAKVKSGEKRFFLTSKFAKVKSTVWILFLFFCFLYGINLLITRFDCKNMLAK